MKLVALREEQMIDRGIGIAGLALSILAGLLGFLAPQLPSWVILAAAVVGIGLLGVGIGMMIGHRSSSRNNRTPVNTASLRLHVYGDSRMPDRITSENIFRWYYLRTIIQFQGPQGPIRHSTMPTLFITFDPEVRISTLTVCSPDLALPMHEVKEFNQKYAIVVFSDDIGPGTLEIGVSP